MHIHICMYVCVLSKYINLSKQERHTDFLSINYYIYSNNACVGSDQAKRTTCFLRVCKGTELYKIQILPIKPAKKSSSSEISPMHMHLHM